MNEEKWSAKFLRQPQTDNLDRARADSVVRRASRTGGARNGADGGDEILRKLFEAVDGGDELRRKFSEAEAALTSAKETIARLEGELSGERSARQTAEARAVAAENRPMPIFDDSSLRAALERLEAREWIIQSPPQQMPPLRLEPAEWKIKARRGSDGKIDLNSVTLQRVPTD